MRSPDACPGVLRPFQAVDGAIVRLRIPGGRTTGRTLRALSDLAVAYGNPDLQLTSRGAIQLRGLPDQLPAGLVAGIEATGVLPSLTHERARNIVCSPLTGMVGGRADLTAMIAELDAGLRADPELAGLPGRFLFALDDGRGDVAALGFDLGYQAVGAEAGRVLVGTAGLGRAIRADEAVSTLLELARGFNRARAATGAWYVRDVPAWVDSLDLDKAGIDRGGPPPLGPVGDAASVLVPLARLTPDRARVVDLVSGGGPVVVTPWRGLVVPGAGRRLADLDAAGFLVADDDPWAQLSACVGAPRCRRARTDTIRVAEALAGLARPLPRTHVSGCDRRCGAPTGDYLDLVAVGIAEAVSAVGAGSR